MEVQPPPYSLRPTAVHPDSASQKTQTGTPILSDEELLKQLFQWFSGIKPSRPIEDRRLNKLHVGPIWEVKGSHVGSNV